VESPSQRSFATNSATFDAAHRRAHGSDLPPALLLRRTYSSGERTPALSLSDEPCRSATDIKTAAPLFDEMSLKQNREINYVFFLSNKNFFYKTYLDSNFFRKKDY
jgi:hypothetical protein